MSLERYLTNRIDVDVNTKDYGGKTALAWAARQPRAAMLQRLLMQRDIDVNKADIEGWTPLHHAVMSGNAKAVDFLLSSRDILSSPRDNKGRTPEALIKESHRIDQRSRALLQLLFSPSSTPHARRVAIRRHNSAKSRRHFQQLYEYRNQQ